MNVGTWYFAAYTVNVNGSATITMIQPDDTIATSFIDGKTCENVDLVLNTLKKFKNTKPTNKVNFNSYIERIKTHLDNNPQIRESKKLIDLLNTINPPNTFNHGDFSTHNMIESEGKLYLIDPIYSEELFQSYVIDAAKHLFSTLYYSLNPELYNQCYSEYVTKLNISELELDVLIACESIRVANRKKQFIDISNNLIDIL